ncbi:DNA/RNA non-specific endonuclease [Apilactobacillus kunkeei]|uniref:DNA/RNA non-specific endonuclease n=1 Tax=Apilactobacillus kunkeei TaxID=148814 RepID=A0A0M9DEI4_9LACO|nr:DNA/RNA non-specific endonuclease [Apilactobacillus kunkeei]
MKYTKLMATLTIGFSLVLSGCANNSNENTASKSSKSSDVTKDLSNTNTSDLASLNYQNNTPAIMTVNNDASNLKASDWKYNHVEYTNLDSLNRTSEGNTAYLEKRNIANDSLRTRQVVQPTGWHQKFVNNDAIINRGHEIAYSLSKGISVNGKYEPSVQSGDQNNLKNLFTQTAFSNQKLQTIYESQVREALRKDKKVIFQVTPIFRGNELMARGVHMQAISTDGSLNFNVYIFNVQPGVEFDYATGKSKINNEIKVPTPENAPSFNNYRNSYRKHHYVRDAVVAGVVHHEIKKHYEKKYRKEYKKETEHHQYHSRRHYYRHKY